MSSKIERMAEILERISCLSADTGHAARDAVKSAKALCVSIKSSNGQLKKALLKNGANNAKNAH